MVLLARPRQQSHWPESKPRPRPSRLVPGILLAQSQGPASHSWEPRRYARFGDANAFPRQPVPVAGQRGRARARAQALPPGSPGHLARTLPSTAPLCHRPPPTVTPGQPTRGAPGGPARRMGRRRRGSACLAGVMAWERAGRRWRPAAEGGEGSKAPGHTPGSRSARAFSSTSKSNPGGGHSRSMVPGPAPWSGGTPPRLWPQRPQEPSAGQQTLGSGVQAARRVGPLNQSPLSQRHQGPWLENRD